MLDCVVMSDDLRAALAEFAERLDQKLDSRFAAIDRRFDAIDQRFDAMEQRFVLIDERFDAVEQRFVLIDERFDAVDQRFGAGDLRFAAIDDRFVAMERRIDESAAETRNFARILTEGLRDDLKRVGDGVIAANEKIDAVRRDVETLDAKVDRMGLELLSATSAPARRLKRRH